MTALAVADVHLSSKSRDSYRFKAMDKIADLIEHHKVDELLILGDLTEEKDFHSAQLVNDVVDVIYTFSELCDVLALKGNHDYTQADCPFFHFLRRIDHVRWINTVKRIDLSVGGCLFLAHTRNWQEDWKSQLPMAMTDLNWVFAHNTFEGATTEHGKVLSGIPTEPFEETRVISGDINTPQTLGPVTYVGAPYTIDFGDDYEPRVLLLTEKGFSSIPLPGPQKRLLEFESGYKPDFNANPGDIVKARYHLASGEQDNWYAIKELLRRQLSEAGLIVHLIQPVTTAKTRSVVVRKATAKSDEHLVQEFGKQLSVPPATLKVGLGLLKEA